MADAEIKLEISAIDKVTVELQKIKEGIDSLNKSAQLKNTVSGFESLKGSITAVAAAIYTAKAALGTIISLTNQLTKEAVEQQKAETLLASALAQKGILTKKLLQDQIDYASAIQKTTVYGDDEIISTQTRLVQYGIEEKQLNALTQAAMDLASAKRIDLATASDLVAKTVTTSTNALARQGIQIKNVYDQTERATVVTKEIARLFGGSASAEASTYAGSIKQLGSSFNEFSESIGMFIVKSPFAVGAIKGLTKFFYDLSDAVNNNREKIEQYIKDGLDVLINSFKLLVVLVGAATAAFKLYEGFVLAMSAAFLKLAEYATDFLYVFLKMTNIMTGGVAFKETLDRVDDLGNKFKMLSKASLQAAGDAVGGIKDITKTAGFLNEKIDEVRVTASKTKLSEMLPKNAAKTAKKAITQISFAFAETTKNVDSLKTSFNKLLISFSDPAIKGALENNLKILDTAPQKIKDLTNEIKKAAFEGDANKQLSLTIDRGKLQSELSRALSEIPAQKISLAISAGVGFAEALGSGAQDFVKAAATGVASAFAGPEVGGAIGRVVGVFGGSVEDFTKKMMDTINGIPQIIKNIFANIGVFFKEVIPTLIEQIPDIVQAFIDAIPDIILSIVEAIPVIIQKIIEAIPTIISNLISSLPRIISEIVMRIPQIILEFIKNIPQIIQSFILSFVQNIPNIINSFIREIPNIAINFIRGLIDAIPELMTALIKTFTDPKFYMEIAKALVDGIIEAIKGLIGGAGDVIGGIGGIIGDIGGAIGDVVGGIGDFFGGLFAKGGVVPGAANGMVTGHSTSGDKQLVRVNSGEMILNKEQQALLWEMVNGQSQQSRSQQPVVVNLMVEEKNLASVLLDINRKGYRTA